VGTPTVREVVDAAAETLTAAGCDQPRHDAAELVAAVFGLTVHDIDVHRSQAVSKAALERIEAYVARRRHREPLAYITGRCTYRGIVLAIDSRVIVPHVQSGQLVDIALNLPRGARVHDVGCGAGPIALALKHERPDLVVTGSDISAPAVDVARDNAATLALDVPFTVAAGVPPGDYDLVLADLPYGDEAATVVRQQPETRHEPQVAHYGGTAGHETIGSVVRSIRTDTRVAIQHAIAQTDVVRAMLTEPDTFGDPRYGARFTTGQAA
jgi:release factor glutamine methyltransferase